MHKVRVTVFYCASYSGGSQLYRPQCEIVHAGCVFVDHLCGIQLIRTRKLGFIKCDTLCDEIHAYTDWALGYTFIQKSRFSSRDKVTYTATLTGVVTHPKASPDQHYPTAEYTHTSLHVYSFKLTFLHSCFESWILCLNSSVTFNEDWSTWQAVFFFRSWSDARCDLIEW